MGEIIGDYWSVEGNMMGLLRASDTKESRQRSTQCVRNNQGGRSLIEVFK